MKITPNSPLVQNISLSDLVRYLRNSTWRPTAPYKKGIQVFQGPPDLNGDPLEIVLPIDGRSPDKDMYTASALNLLSALNNQDPENIAYLILEYDKDVLRIRNIETEGYNSIEMNTAAVQVSAMRQLVAYSAQAEYRARPYYHDISRAANRTLRHFRFGPTFVGSFGFTIESRVSDQGQLSFASDPDAPATQQLMRRPIERRVIERIMRGLLSVQRSLHSNDPSIISDSYRTGFNLNMCNAILEISHGEKARIEYDISWSPKISSPSDMASSGPIVLDEESYKNIREAARRLRRFDAEETTIIGNVTALISRDNPLSSEEKSRHVTVRWGNRPEGRAVDVNVFLQKEDYIQAHDAHLNWHLVQVQGVIMRRGDYWELSYPHDFRILSPNSTYTPIQTNLV